LLGGDELPDELGGAEEPLGGALLPPGRLDGEFELPEGLVAGER